MAEPSRYSRDDVMMASSRLRLSGPLAAGLDFGPVTLGSDCKTERAQECLASIHWNSIIQLSSCCCGQGAKSSHLQSFLARDSALGHDCQCRLPQSRSGHGFGVLHMTLGSFISRECARAR